jgi:DNA-binding NarL/FixJ family response regulator
VTGGAGTVVARIDSDAELAALVTGGDGAPQVLLTADPRGLAPRALQAGVSAVLNADASEGQLVAAVMSVAHGLVVVPAGVVRAPELPPLAEAPEPLTTRELEVLGLMAGGDSNKVIAARLAISVHTVKSHISSILTKLGVATRTEAVALALRLGWVLL